MNNKNKCSWCKAENVTFNSHGICLECGHDSFYNWFVIIMSALEFITCLIAFSKLSHRMQFSDNISMIVVLLGLPIIFVKNLIIYYPIKRGRRNDSHHMVAIFILCMFFAVTIAGYIIALGLSDKDEPIEEPAEGEYDSDEIDEAYIKELRRRNVRFITKVILSILGFIVFLIFVFKAIDIIGIAMTPSLL